MIWEKELQNISKQMSQNKQQKSEENEQLVRKHTKLM